jgi:DNA invertase Pin-like site-specific DNA recombinase
MAMYRGYVRETSNGMPVVQQIEMLGTAGVNVDGEHARVYVDRLADRRQHRAASGDALCRRAALLSDLHPGERLVVASLDRLGVSAGDIRAIVDKVIDFGCSVHDAAVGVTYDAETPRSTLSTATLAAESLLGTERISKARTVRAERIASGARAAVGGNRGWRPTEEERAAAKHDWLVKVDSMSQADIEAKHGVNRITLRRQFGPRGAARGRRKKNDLE